MPVPSTLACVLAAALSSAASGQTVRAAQEPSTTGPPSCRFIVPEGWPAHHVRWSGGCSGGLAQGRGTLRAYEGGGVARIFYGRLEAGQPVLGVIERDDGFVAGRFESGKVVADGERNTLIEAFDEASAAARQAAEGYRRAGNTASARYYEYKARQLSRQLD